ncbi:MAG TPA: hypothetical protein VL403_08760 [Candidatus Kryptonia bacterium]|nr:hypothetical protein [Candidatus Kryptonia bacterium]
MQRKPTNSAWAIAIGIIATSVALIFARSTAGLIDDDAYIFLRYAEHLAQGDRLAFNLGEPSAGVTSILWVLVLAFARRLTGADMILIAQALGALCFGSALVLMTRSFEGKPEHRWGARVGGVIAALSPVFICQAISGMDVALNMLLVTLALTSTSAFATGLAYLTRPDNVLILPAVAGLAPTRRLRTALMMSTAVIAFGLPWAVYCWRVGGSLLPPTRVGKLLVFLPGWYGVTAPEFAAMALGARLSLAARALARVGSMFTQGQARALLIWIPLFPLGLAKASRAARAALLLFALSAVAYALVFPLVKLRYFVHLTLWLVPLGLLGLQRMIPPRWHRALFGLLVAGHLAVCARALPRYRDWVACEGTKTLAGQWLATHTPADARLALEPIGAVGYHSQRYVIDLGGLIAADVWPVIRNGPEFDPNEMFDYLRERRADYVIDQVDGPWAGRLLRARPDSLRLVATIPGPTGCGVIGVYALQR